MNLFHVILYGISIFIVLAALLLAAAAATGYDKPAFPVLESGARVTIEGNETTISDLAAKYQPVMALRSTTPSPPLLWVWYQAVPAKDSIDLIYYHVWQDEINPNPWVHKVYSLFRAAYYGYPLYDIEYLQVSVSPQNGAITGLRFETSPGNDYFPTLSEHKLVRYQLCADGSYEELVIKKDGEVLSRTPGAPVFFEGQHVRVGAATWNHLTRLVAPAETDYNIRFNPELKPLAAEEYAHYKFVRKSQGDHRTAENTVGFVLSRLAMLVILGLPVGLAYLLRLRRSTAGK